MTAFQHIKHSQLSRDTYWTLFDLWRIYDPNLSFNNNEQTQLCIPTISASCQFKVTCWIRCLNVRPFLEVLYGYFSYKTKVIQICSTFISCVCFYPYCESNLLQIPFISSFTYPHHKSIAGDLYSASRVFVSASHTYICLKDSIKKGESTCSNTVPAWCCFVVHQTDQLLTKQTLKWSENFSINLYLCLINNGLPRHLKVTLLPSGMSPSLTSILASARTSADALIELTNSPTKVLAAYVPTTAPPKQTWGRLSVLY